MSQMPRSVDRRQHRRAASLLLCVLAGWALIGVSAQAAGPEEPLVAKAAITERLNRWTAAFNAKDMIGICDLFAPDLSYTIDDIPNGTRDGLCGNVDKVLRIPGLTLRYDEPAIHEILVSGDLAVVRLTWTLTAEKNGAKDVTTEEGMDVFRRAQDGGWSIARYIAFTTRPNTVLKAEVPPR
jgi:ketosteroid isomerase-like protein